MVPARQAEPSAGNMCSYAAFTSHVLLSYLFVLSCSFEERLTHSQPQTFSSLQMVLSEKLLSMLDCTKHRQINF